MKVRVFTLRFDDDLGAYDDQRRGCSWPGSGSSDNPWFAHRAGFGGRTRFRRQPRVSDAAYGLATMDRSG